MGLKVIYRHPRTSTPALGHKIYPYPLKDLKITRPNQIWSADISVPQKSITGDEGRSLAIGLQEQVANHHKRPGSKVQVVSVMEKVSGMNQRRRTLVNCRLRVESRQMTSKLGGYVIPGLACTIPAYGTGGVRYRGSVSLVWAPMMNCGNLRRRWQGKGTSEKCEADSTDAPSRDGVTCSSDEVTVMAMERRGHVIQSCLLVNCCISRRNQWA